MHERVRQTHASAGATAVARPDAQRRPAPVQCKLTVGRADDPAEREADHVAATVIARLRAGAPERSGDAATGDVSSAGPVLQRMEGAFGADFGGVRLHTGSDVDIAADGLQARAFTHGKDVFIRRSEYRPGTAAGDELIADELTHTLQQGSSEIRRSVADPIRVERRVGADAVHLKKQKMHLDFVRMKRLDPQFSKIIKKKLGMNVTSSGDTYGHWWTEIGDRDPITDEFDYTHSYGWWPANGVGGVGDTFKGVPGSVNQGEEQDPHAGEDAATEFHPVMEVDPDKETYDQIRARVSAGIRRAAWMYKGTWEWRFGWGQNCHTFQQHIKTKTGLHFQKSSKWLNSPTAMAEAQQRADARAADEQRKDEVRAQAERWINVKPAQIGVVDPMTGVESSIESGGRIGPTGRTMKDLTGFDCVEIVTDDGATGWILELELRQYDGTYNHG